MCDDLIDLTDAEPPIQRLATLLRFSEVQCKVMLATRLPTAFIVLLCFVASNFVDDDIYGLEYFAGMKAVSKGLRAAGVRGIKTSKHKVVQSFVGGCLPPPPRQTSALR